MSKTKIITQVQKIDEMIKVLEDACTYMEWCTKEVDKAIEARVAQGFPEDKANDYKDTHWNSAKGQVDKAASAIRTAHIPYLIKVKEPLLRILSM